MDSSKSSISFNMSMSSDSDNETRSHKQFNKAKIDFKKTFSPYKTKHASTLSRQLTNNSIKYFKNLQRKNTSYKSEKQLKNKISASTYSLRSSKAVHNLSNSRNVPKYKKKSSTPKNVKTSFSSSTDLSKELAYAFESSSDSDFPDIKYLKLVTKNEELNTSSVSIESRKSTSFSDLKNIKQPENKSWTNNNEHCGDRFESSSSISFEISSTNNDFVNFQKKPDNVVLNLDELLSDCSSLSDVLFIREDNGDKKVGHLFPAPDTDNFFSQTKSTPAQSPLPLNTSLGTDNEPLSHQLFNATLDLSNLINGVNEDQNQSVDKTIDSQELSLNDVNSLPHQLLNSSTGIPNLINVINKDDQNQSFDKTIDSQELSLNDVNSLPHQLLNSGTGIPNLINVINKDDQNQSVDKTIDSQELSLIDVNSLPHQLLNSSTGIPNLINVNNKDDQNQSNGKIATDVQEPTLSITNSKGNQSFSNQVELNMLELGSNSLESVAASTSEIRCSRCKRSEKLKSGIESIIHNTKSETKETKKRKIKHPRTKTVPNDSVVQVKKLSTVKRVKNHHSSDNFEDIGLEYDMDRDNYMVELPGGAVVPAFLSTLKPKNEKRLCACGITASEVPLSWSESFHGILHSNIYKLRFKGNVPENGVVNIKQNDLTYKILALDVINYNDANIKKTINDVDYFVSLEYGIYKSSIPSYTNSRYLAVLSNLKVIGYLEVKPIHNAQTLSHDDQLSDSTLPVKFGVSKIWVLIKYRDKNVDTNLLETFREKEHLQKEDIAFSLRACLGVKFIQEYTGEKNILIYNET